MTQFSEWIPFTGTSCPVDELRIVEVETGFGTFVDQAGQFQWFSLPAIKRYRVELTDDEIAEEEEWTRLEKASKTG